MNGFSTSVPAVARRPLLALLGLGVLTTTFSRLSSAAINGLVVIGLDGWLFPVWDEVRKSDAVRIHDVTQGINEAVALLKKVGIQTVISLTPTKSRIYHDFLPNDFRFVSNAEHRYSIALEDLRRPGTLVPDLATLLANLRKSRPAEALFFKTDTHWTPVSSEAAGNEIAQQIIDKGLLSPSSKLGVQLGDYVQMIQGKNDLADLLPDTEKAKYSSEIYKVRRVITPLGQSALIDDDSGDTILIGNSFTQPKYGYSATISRKLNRPVDLIWKVHQFGPYRTLLDYLKSPAYRRVKPRLIIWNFEETDMEAPSDRSDVWGSNAMSKVSFMTELHKAIGG